MSGRPTSLYASGGTLAEIDSTSSGANARSVRARWIALGVEPAPMTPQAFDQWIRDDIATSIKLARAANIKAD